MAAPLLGATGCATLGYSELARLLLGYGVVCWLTLGSIILARLFTRAALPTPLVPTLAIELAPPVVAGTAWFAINGNRPDTVAYLLAGYAVPQMLAYWLLAVISAGIAAVALRTVVALSRGTFLRRVPAPSAQEVVPST